MGIAHLAFDFGLGCKGRHRVDDDHIERTGAHQHVGDFKRLFTRIGLADEQFVDIDPDGPGVHGIHGVLGVDIGADATIALCLGHDVHGESGLTRRLGTVDLDDTATGQTTHAECEVERQCTRGHHLDGQGTLLAHPHDGTLAVLLVDLGQCHFECLVAIVAHDRVSLFCVAGA